MRDFWACGRELRVGYDRLYEIPVEGFRGVGHAPGRRASGGRAMGCGRSCYPAWKSVVRVRGRVSRESCVEHHALLVAVCEYVRLGRSQFLHTFCDLNILCKVLCMKLSCHSWIRAVVPLLEDASEMFQLLRINPPRFVAPRVAVNTKRWIQTPPSRFHTLALLQLTHPG